MLIFRSPLNLSPLNPFSNYQMGYQIRSAATFIRDDINLVFSEALAREKYGDDVTQEQIDNLRFEAEGKVFRHIASQAYLYIRYGHSISKFTGDWYERYSSETSATPNSDEKRNRDLINNAYGRALGLQYGYETGTTFKDTKEVADFLNATVNYVRESYGMDPLTKDQYLFNANTPGLERLVIPSND